MHSLLLVEEAGHLAKGPVPELEVPFGKRPLEERQLASWLGEFARLASDRKVLDFAQQEGCPAESLRSLYLLCSGQGLPALRLLERYRKIHRWTAIPWVPRLPRNDEDGTGYPNLGSSNSAQSRTKVVPLTAREERLSSMMEVKAMKCGNLKATHNGSQLTRT